MKKDYNHSSNKQRNYSKNKKDYKPSKSTPQPQKQEIKPNQQTLFDGFFSGNLVNNMNFGNKDHELSGYVHREVTFEDQHGNKQTAKEQQFFNSGKAMQVAINGKDNGKNKSR